MQVSNYELQNITDSIHTEPVSYRSDTEATLDDTSFGEDEEIRPIKVLRNLDMELEIDDDVVETSEEYYNKKGRALDNIDGGYKIDYTNMDENELIKILHVRICMFSPCYNDIFLYF